MKRAFLSFNQKPFLISAQSNLANFSVYLDINNKSRLEGLYFKCPEESIWFSFFSSLAIELERVPLRDLEKVVELWKQVNHSQLKGYFLVPPLELLERALDQYYGNEVGHSEVSAQSSEELLCRCFGVYKSQVKELVENNENVDLKFVSNELRASVGCTSCSDSVISAIDFFKAQAHASSSVDLSLEFDEQGNRVRPLGLTPSEFVLKIDSLSKSWIKEQELKGVSLNISNIKGHTLGFKVTPSKNAKYILDTFCDYACEKLGLVLRFDLLS